MCNPDPKQVVRIRATLYTLYRFADQSLFNVFLPARAWRRNCEDASGSPMKGPLKLLMKTPLHRPIDPWTNPPGSTCGRSSPRRYPELQRFAGKPGLHSGFCPQVPTRSACSMAKPSPSATHGNSYFNFSGLSRGKVDKRISSRHLQALERLLHSQHVFAHQFTSQGVQHFLWAWQSLSPSNIFKPCTRAYER